MKYPADVPVLSDGRVTLRPHTRDDVEGVYEQCIDPTSIRCTTVPVPYTHQHAADYIERRAAAWENDSDWGFAIEADGGSGPGRFGGSISVGVKGSGIGEIAFGAHPGVRGNGVMTAAVRLIVDWAFHAERMRTISWQCNAGNYASWRVAWKNGFTFEGSARASLPQRDDALDGWRASLLSTDSREPKTRWLEPVTLTGERVVLRELQESDEQRYLETTNDPESLRWLATVPLARTAEAFQHRLVNRLVPSSLGHSVGWTIADPDTDTYLGSVDLFGLNGLDFKSAEGGYRTHPDARGRGVLKEGLRLAIGHAFRAGPRGLGLQRIHLGCGDGNLASQGIARSLGFTETGRDRRCYDLYDGSIVDLIRFDLLKSEFNAGG